MRAFVLMASLILGGCLTTTNIKTVTNPLGLQDWKIKGKVATSIADQGGSASFIWKNHQESYQIELYGPLGSGRMILEQTENLAFLKDKDAIRTSKSLEKLLYRQLGWIIPLNELKNWVIGRPHPGKVQDMRFHEGTIKAFTQAQWHVEYDKFITNGNYFIPRKITLNASKQYLDELNKRVVPPIEFVKVKIIIKEFAL